MLEVDGAQAVADPFVEVNEDSRSIGQLKVLLPANQITSQFCRDLFDAASACAPRDEAHSLFHRRQGFLRHSTLHHFARRIPEGIAEQFAVRREVDRAFRLVDA